MRHESHALAQKKKGFFKILYLSTHLVKTSNPNIKCLRHEKTYKNMKKHNQEGIHDLWGHGWPIKKTTIS